MKKLLTKIFKSDSEKHINESKLAIALEEAKRSKVESAYKILTTAANKKKVTKVELTAAMEEAIGYLGEVLA